MTIVRRASPFGELRLAPPGDGSALRRQLRPSARAGSVGASALTRSRSTSPTSPDALVVEAALPGIRARGRRDHASRTAR